MNKFKKIVLVLFFFGIAASPAYAETRVSGPVGDTTWSLAGSPYLLTGDVTIPDGITLNVDAGVTVKPAPEAVPPYINENPFLYITGGRLIMNGKSTKHISMTDLGGIFVNGGSMKNGSIEIKYVDITGGTSIWLDNSLGYIASSSISGASTALNIKDSIVSIDGSYISGNQTAINVDPHRPILMGLVSPNNINSHFGTGGYGNALAEAPDIYASSSLTIRNSSLTGNTFKSILNNNNGEFTVDAIGNWWGSDSGPTFSGDNSIYGPVSYTPWLRAKPSDEQIVANKICCSNVVFIPGLEGTRLHLGTNQLWEPNWNTDVRKLFLDKNGSSTIKNIYSSDPIDVAFGIKDIYGKFMKFMDSMVAKGDINEWKPFGYDWRMSVPSIVTTPQRKESGSESLIDDILAMASTSKTGKVTLVTHSTGGLVAKYLVKTLNDMGKASLIDSVISVAVPYIGTPKAVAALLHGYGTELGGGFLASKENMRELGSNMASAYGLLPSAQYFTQVFTPTIVFASTTADTYAKQKDFITDPTNTRPTPSIWNTKIPIIGNKLLTNAAEALHGVLDTFEWPATIARWAIVGWNTDTLKSLVYKSKQECGLKFLKNFCVSKLYHEASTTIMGDGTVVAPSAAYKGGKVISSDLKNISASDSQTIDHVNILEASSTENTISKIIKGDGNEASFELPSGMTWGEPDYSKDGTFLTLSTHSPVDLHIYDEQGRHTGPIPKPSQLANNDFIEGMYEENIPGSSYSAYGSKEEGYDTYINLRNGQGEKYRMVINGTDFGFFTAEAEQFQDGRSLDHVMYDMEPVTPLTIATTTVGGNFVVNTFIPIASTTPTLFVDIDGNGTAEYTAKTGGTGWPGNATSTEGADKVAQKLYLETIKITINSLSISTARKNALLKKVDRISELFAKNKFKAVTNKVERISKHLGHLKLKTASQAVVQSVADEVEGQLDDTLEGQ